MPPPSSRTTYVLITGTNGGLGLGICTRLIDDFLRDRPSSSTEESLTLIFTTRSTRKSDETLKHLETYLAKNHAVDGQYKRIRLRPENVELTNLLSVRDLARKLSGSSSSSLGGDGHPGVEPLPKLDAIICNAGIGGWSGLDWPRAVGTILYDIVTNTTWPTFKLGIAGLITQRQFAPPQQRQQDIKTGGETEKEEPILGQIFCANVFGHYMLVHWLMPLLLACGDNSNNDDDNEDEGGGDTGRIIWVGSIEPRARHYREDDFMGLKTAVAYEHTKRLTDLLALSYDDDSVSGLVDGFVGFEEGQENEQRGADGTNTNKKTTRIRSRKRPTMHVAQPGICTTSIVTLHWIVHQFYILGIYLARLAGSPWATMSTYTAALTFSWLTLASSDEVREEEAKFGSRVDVNESESPSRKASKGKVVGRVKWGTAVTRSGRASVKPTEVEGWGINGSGRSFAGSWWGGKYGRAPGTRDARGEDVDEFVRMGGRAWKGMEELRREWERRIDEFDEEGRRPR